MTNPREAVLHTATRLFYKAGVRAIGVDRIIAESGVAKATFYRHFPSKDELVAVALSARDAPTREWFIAQAEARADADGISPVLALFDVLFAWFATPSFNGCPFARTALELTGNEQVRAIAAEHKNELEAWLAQSLGDGLNSEHAATNAKALMLVLDGAIVRALIERDPESVARAARAAVVAIMEAKP
jgi:AcrR family transcriptional regulator